MEYKQEQVIVFLDRDGVINKERSYISKPDEMELYPFTAKAIRKLNESGALVIVVSNQSAIARGYMTLKELELVHNKLKNDLAKQNASIDAIFFCPHLPLESVNQPIKNEFIKACGCRKPGTGLFLNALLELNFEKAQSKMFMVGDSERDILAGRKFGCTTIGVKTGHACQGNTTLPDYFCDNLLEAVELILEKLEN